jgi:hypothetical protein
LKPVVLTGHAKTALAERNIELKWVEATARTPEWRAPDATEPQAERRFAPVAERGGRVLRVACVETDTEIRVLTVFFDRKAKRPA